PDKPDWPTAYYGRNLPRLRRVARRYDPDRVLAFPQGLA
ncbi:BBE domain-containing protein, partial [Actinosynnema sp. NPDC023658]